MDNQIQNKLFNYGEQPRSKVWEDIVSALDDQQTETSEKLYNYQQQPALQNWDKITAALDNDTKAAVIPFTKRYGNYIKKAGAVAALAILIFSATLLFNQKTADSNITEQASLINNNPVNKKLQQQPGPSNNVAQTNTVVPQDDKEYNVLKNTYTFAKNAVTKYKAQKLNEDVERPHITTALLSSARTSLVNENSLDKYIVVTAEDGKAVKMPKKLYDKLQCADTYIDYEKACKEALASLQQKIATQISSTDFTGLIDMLQNLQENQ